MQTFKRIVIVVLTLLVGAVSAQAEEERSYTLGVEVDYASRYIWRGFDLQDNDPSLQPSAYMELALGDQLTAGYLFWSNYALVKGDAGFNEYDHELYLNYALSELADIDLGTVIYEIPNDNGTLDTQEVYLGLNLALHDLLTTSLKVYYDIDLIKGFYGQLSAETSFPLAERFEGSASVGLGYMYDYDDITGFSDLPLSLGISADLGGGLWGYTSLHHSITLDDEINDEDETWFMAGLGFDY